MFRHAVANGDLICGGANRLLSHLLRGCAKDFQTTIASYPIGEAGKRAKPRMRQHFRQQRRSNRDQTEDLLHTTQIRLQKITRTNPLLIDNESYL